MALRIAFTPSTIAAPASSSSVGSQPCFPPFASKKDLGLRSCVVSSSIFHLRSRHDASTIARAVEQAASTCVGGVVEVTQETFWPAVEAAGDKLVVLDLYTQWCGPCKIMYPKIVDLSGKYTDVLFLKLDCNQDNKALAKKLGVKVVPTFKIFKNGQEIAEVKGAKFDEIVQNIDKARAS